LIESYADSGVALSAARYAGFAVIAIGALGCIVAGYFADRMGRTKITILSLVVSGVCCLLVGSMISNPVALTIIAIVWGFAVVADSAQFSTALSELADPRYVGTALTIQTSLGFLLTLVTIRGVPYLVELVGWEYALMPLAIGPIIGVLSMYRLRMLPDALKMASGHR
jgi:MFS family permease